MQRELRFRMWSNEKCFKYIDNVLNEIDGCYISTDRLKIGQCGTMRDAHREDVTIEQYIGISDEDGTPIYENDIIEAQIYRYAYSGALSAIGTTTIKGTVTFNQGCWCIDTNPFSKLFNYKVIGNIHTE